MEFNDSQLIYKLKRLALKRGYTKNRIAAELGVSITCIYQRWKRIFSLGQTKNY